MILHKFYPQIKVWFSNKKGKSHICTLFDETWYEGEHFKRGYFAFLNLGFVTVHIVLSWWKFKI